MPHLQFEFNFTPSAQDKGTLAKTVVDLFGTVMDTGTDHIGITFRCYAKEDLVLGRTDPQDGRVVFLNADIRNGRTKDQKRRLALGIMDAINGLWGVPKESMYIVYTEHDGENFQLSDRVLPSWKEGEDPLYDPVE
eukprot:comp25177_c0_seq1/m.46967 comp25177_c0_seq1/g.46967  ORF comp25177_c0_seq1/g.46967 comp25177_c0_seq1/m.46967 type:complete len:136 (-) comp25177_c0_seq1:323-730(-)